MAFLRPSRGGLSAIWRQVEKTTTGRCKPPSFRGFCSCFSHPRGQKKTTWRAKTELNQNPNLGRTCPEKGQFRVWVVHLGRSTRGEAPPCSAPTHVTTPRRCGCGHVLQLRVRVILVGLGRLRPSRLRNCRVRSSKAKSAKAKSAKAKSAKAKSLKGGAGSKKSQVA